MSDVNGYMLLNSPDVLECEDNMFQGRERDWRQTHLRNQATNDDSCRKLRFADIQGEHTGVYADSESEEHLRIIHKTGFL